MMSPLTSRQRDILTVIAAYRCTHDYAPSVREIGQTARVKGAQSLDIAMRGLVDAGWLTRTPHVARSLVITPAGYAALREAVA